MEELNLFIDIISNSKNVNNLPALSDIYHKLENLSEIGDSDYDIETDCMIDNWHGTKVTLIDGSTIELVNSKSCILHSYDDLDKEYSYMIGDNLYICAGCLSIMVEHENLSIEEFKSMHNEVNKVKHERKNIWKQEDCQILYNRIINYVQDPTSLTRPQLNQAKDMSISAILKNKTLIMKDL